MTPETTAEDLEREIEQYRADVRHVLLDTSVGGSSGGTGKTFDWSMATGLVDAESMFVAGGLGPDNILDAISQLNPYGVDVSSGVEEAPGVKSFEKVSALIDSVRDATP